MDNPFGPTKLTWLWALLFTIAYFVGFGLWLELLLLVLAWSSIIGSIILLSEVVGVSGTAAITLLVVSLFAALAVTIILAYRGQNRRAENWRRKPYS